jgi:ribosomal protein S18 acetylase RimI-like enzyme
MNLVPITFELAASERIRASALLSSVCDSTLATYPPPPEPQPWIGYLAEEDGDFKGTCAFKSPPQDGRVEIAYFTFPAFEGHGVATRMTTRLLGLARAHGALEATAHTLPQENPSTRILRRLGFQFTGVVNHPQDGPVWAWCLDLTACARRAQPGDARKLAELMNEAGEGLPAWLWSRLAEPGEDPFEAGTRRVEGTTGGFSHVNAHVLEAEGEVVGMLLGYPLQADADDPVPDGVPEVVRPLLELERLAPGTWYVNAVAVHARARGQGMGGRLMALAEQLSVDAGLAAVSLIVAAANEGALGLYRRLGYREIARRPIVPFPGCVHSGDWLLLTKELAGRPGR